MAGFSLSLKLDEALEKFATPLWIAFFTVAAVVQPPSDHIPDWLIATVAWIVRHVLPLPLDPSSASPVLTVLITAGITGVFAAAYGIFLFFFVLMLRALMTHAWINWLGTVLLLSIGIGFISMGALALCKVPLLHTMAIQDPLPSLNLFWEIGFFLYGVWWLQLYEVVENR
jgi:hypothetical protein